MEALSRNTENAAGICLEAGVGVGEWGVGGVGGRMGSGEVGGEGEPPPHLTLSLTSVCVC